MDQHGTHLWSKQFGDNDNQYASAMAVDAMGNVLITGYFYGTVDFGGGPLICKDMGDIFVAKFNTQGNHLWSRRFGDEHLGSWIGSVTSAATVDSAGNVLLTGYFGGTVDFGSGPLTSAGYADIFLAKLRP